jgi:hypothetical protein
MNDDIIARHKKNKAKVREASPPHADTIDMLKDQLLIVFLRRLTTNDGGKISIPVTEIDDTGRFNLAFSVVDGSFHFELQRKPS